MIPILEIKAIARKKRIPGSTVERDYAQNWLLFGLSKTSLKMALKGGTGIKKIVHPLIFFHCLHTTWKTKLISRMLLKHSRYYVL